MRPYIDVRSAWPTLFIGYRAFVLEGKSRSITIWQAIEYLTETGQI